MPASELLKEIPPSWRSVPIAVQDGIDAYNVRNIQLITSAAGKRVVVIGYRTPGEAINIAAKATPGATP